MRNLPRARVDDGCVSVACLQRWYLHGFDHGVGHARQRRPTAACACRMHRKSVIPRPWCAAPVGAPGAVAPTPPPTPRFVRQSLDALLQKSLHPFVHKATADPDPDSNVGDRDAIGEEEDHPGTSEQPETDGGRPLPGEERLAFLRREGDSERGCASTRHTASLCARGAARDNLGSRDAQG